MKYLITGGAGFIGSAVVRQLIGKSDHEVCNIDVLTYAGNLSTVSDVSSETRYTFEHENICDAQRMKEIFESYQPDIVMHFAAESHVDRSIDGPGAFVQTNIVGTYVLLEAARNYWASMPTARAADFRFQHISTDEVYGSLGPEGLFREDTPYQPNSPYSASKAASDHLVRAWGETYGLPVITTNCSNNYGPYQYPEKLIPVMILNALHGERLPVYGAGQNVRDWLYVEDHARGLIEISQNARPGATYNLGGNAERRNIEVVESICEILDRLGVSDHSPHNRLIEFVEDRPGHDARYAIDASKVKSEIGWVPTVTFEEGLEKTIRWYVDNRDWWAEILSSNERFGRRIGLMKAQQLSSGEVN